MELYELRSFVVLAEQLHFGRAAKVLHVSQPALTKQIKKVEAELGIALFERGTRGTKLTTFGESWLGPVREVLADLDRVLEQGRKNAIGKLGRLRIGFGFHTFELVPKVIVRLREKSPDVQISLRDMSTAEQIPALLEGALDLGFIRLPAPPGKALKTIPVIEDRLALISSVAGHPEKLRLGDCKNLPFVVISKARAPGFYSHMVTLCALNGFHPRVVQEVAEITTALALVRAGLGVSIIPESFLQNRFAGVQMHRIADARAKWPVGAAWRSRDTNPLIGEFVRLLREELRGGSVPAGSVPTQKSKGS